jgi:hypothetical protein
MTATVPPQQPALDRVLWVIVALAVLTLFASPTRLLFVPFEYDGVYATYTPPNFIDLMWLTLTAVLFLRGGQLSARALLGLALLVVIAGIVLQSSEATPDPEKFADLFLFNCRLTMGLALGALLARRAMPASVISGIVLAGTLIIAASTLVLALGGGGISYDFYTTDQRFGGMGLGPNEAGIVFAGAFNMLPMIFGSIPLSALAAPILLAGVIAAGSRTATLLVIPGVFLWIPTIRRRYHGRQAVLAWVAFILFAALVAWIEYEVTAGIASGASSAAFGRFGTTSDVSTQGRIAIYTQVPVYLWTHLGTVLWGVGSSNVAVEDFVNNVLSLGTEHTHNLLLQWVLGYGVAGLVLFGVVVFPMLRRGRRFANDDQRGLRWFGLTMAVGQALQYGLIMEKFLLLFGLLAGYVAAASSRIAVLERS